MLSSSSVDIKLIKYHRELNVIIGFFFKLWRLDFIPDSKWEFVNYLRVLLSPISWTFCGLCSLWHILHMEDYDDLIDVSFTIIFVFAFYQCNMIYLTTHLSNKQNIMKILKFFDEAIVSDEYLLSDLRKKFYFRNTKIAFYVGRVFLTLVTISGMIITIFDIYQARTHFPLFWRLPGIPTTSIFYYPCNYIFQTLMYFSGLEIIFSADVVIIITILYCDAELRVLLELVKDLDDEDVVQSRAKFTISLIHRVHLMISDRADQLTKSLWHIYFHKLFAIMMYLCSVMFIFTKVEASLLVPFLIAVMMISQIFMLCYFGQIIRDCSDDMAQCLYETRWYELHIVDQKDLLMLMVRFQYPIKVETFGFGAISIYTFVQIFKASVSYAMILYTVFN
ncbi:hypothetical protein DMENIID0001_075770 [Sergentomyia squamirostris]